MCKPSACISSLVDLASPEIHPKARPAAQETARYSLHSCIKLSGLQPKLSLYMVIR